MRRTTIVMPDGLADLVQREARRQGVSVSELIRRVIRQTLLGSPSKPRHIPWAGIFEDPQMVEGRRVEEKLEEDWAGDLGSGH